MHTALQLHLIAAFWEAEMHCHIKEHLACLRKGKVVYLSVLNLSDFLKSSELSLGLQDTPVLINLRLSLSTVVLVYRYHGIHRWTCTQR